jgi:Na+-transporting NADH:ubiquinone oxidoreductase subunit NqrB
MTCFLFLFSAFVQEQFAYVSKEEVVTGWVSTAHVFSLVLHRAIDIRVPNKYNSAVYLRSEVLSVANMITVFLDVMPCSLVDRYQHFGGTSYLYLQGRRCKQHLPSKHRYSYLSTKLHGVISHKTIIFLSVCSFAHYSGILFWYDEIRF